MLRATTRADLDGSTTGAIAWLIVAGIAARLLMAKVGLGIDESYMVAAGRTLRLGYFDHPPMSWWLSAGIAHLTGSEAGWVVRLPFILLFALSTWLMFILARTLFGTRAGLWAAVTLNLSPVFGVTTAGWVLPDGPLDCALLAAAFCLVRALPQGRGAWGWWLGAGGAAGCALLAKYSAGLALAGAAVYLLSQPSHRVWMRRPQPYVALLLAAVLFTPVIVWNAQHGWASFAFQGGRTTSDGLRLLGPIKVLAGEALFVLPWLWLPMVVAVLRQLRQGPTAWRGWLLCCLGAGPVMLFAIVGFWSKHVLFHWAAPGYLMWFPLLGTEVERLLARWPRTTWAGLLATAVLLGGAVATLGSELRWHWLPLFTGQIAGAADPELQAIDWTALGDALQGRGLLHRPGTVIATVGWQDAGKVGYALGQTTVICLNQDARQFGFVSDPASYDGKDAVIVTTRPISAEVLADQGYAFDSLEELPAVSLGDGRRPALRLLVYLGRRLQVRQP